MQAFVWDERFVTGLKRVDEQHMHLVDLVNKVGDFLLESRGDEAELEGVFAELATYALEHFAEEEGLIAPAGMRGVIVHYGVAEMDKTKEIYLVQFENGPDGSLGAPIGCLPDELTQKTETAAVNG